MTTSVSCPNCGRPYDVPAEFAGRRFRCRECGDDVAIPALPPIPDPPTGPEADRPKSPVAVTDPPSPAPLPTEPVVPHPGRTTTPARPLAKSRSMERPPSTIVLALVLSATHMLEDFFFILSGFSIAGDAPQTAGPVILAGLVRLAIELMIFGGLMRRQASARLASIVLSALGLGLQLLLVVTMSWLFVSGISLPDLGGEEVRAVAGILVCYGGIGMILRVGDIAALVSTSAAEWCSEGQGGKS